MGTEVLKYDPQVGLHLFTYTHHIYKAELRVNEMQAFVNALGQQFDEAKNGADQLIPTKLAYTQTKLSTALKYFSDPLHPDEQVAIRDISAPTNVTTTADYASMNLRPIGQKPFPPIPTAPRPPATGSFKPLPPIPPVRR